MSGKACTARSGVVESPRSFRPLCLRAENSVSPRQRLRFEETGSNAMSMRAAPSPTALSPRVKHSDLNQARPAEACRGASHASRCKLSSSERLSGGGTVDLNGTKPRPPCWLYCSATFLRPFQVRCPQDQQDLTLCPLTELLALCPAALLRAARHRRNAVESGQKQGSRHTFFQARSVDDGTSAMPVKRMPAAFVL